MIPYIDIHSHRAGIENSITVRSHRLGTCEVEPPAPFSAGIHPWDAAAITDPEALYEYLRNAGVAAIGEIGLDYAVGTDRDIQMEVFEKQCGIASQRGLPVIVHCVKAFGDIVKVFRGAPDVKVVMHGYIGSPEQTKTAGESGFFLSLGGVSLRSPKTLDGLATFPAERLLLETDDSGITIREIYAQASEKLQIPLQELKELIYNNYKTLFSR